MLLTMDKGALTTDRPAIISELFTSFKHQFPPVSDGITSFQRGNLDVHLDGDLKAVTETKDLDVSAP